MGIGRAPRLCAALLLVAATMAAAPARADVADFLGKPIASVRLEAEGRDITDRNIVALLETRTGDPLRCERSGPP